MYASIITDIKNQHVNQVYDYIIPEELVDLLEVGMRVLVPFGPQKRLGYVINITDKSDHATKKIISSLDIMPTISKEMFTIADFMRDTNIAPFASIIQTIIPAEFSVKYEREVHLLSDDIKDDLKIKFNNKGIWKLKNEDTKYFNKLKKLASEHIIEIKNNIITKEKTKTETVYQYNQQNNYAKIAKYQDILSIFYDNNTQSRKTLLNNGFTVSTINTLLKNGCLIENKQEINRDIKHKFTLEEKKVVLNSEQKLAYERIRNSFDTNKKFLLKGITGSGKTEIYLNLINDIIMIGKNAIILVPEISLIAPLAQRLKSGFFDAAIISSGISSGERHDEWLKIKKNEVNVVLGTRSAIFAPLDNIGIIIIDESHDKSYQQEEKVIYDAIEIAILRSSIHNCPLLLGTATPSIKQMYLAKNNEYELLTLTKMAQIKEKPLIKLIDMREELHNGNTSIFSYELKKAINERLTKKEQIILLYNRKGYAPFVLCRNCGYVPTCPNCNISLTYYKKKDTLKCHYCGHEETYTNICPLCKQKTIKEVGVGIELIHEKLLQEFPNASILRMDANTTSKKGSHEDIWLDFKNKKADILLGTQMVAKGFDFDNVSLVGVLMADTLLKIPNYSSSEEAYTLLTQVVGRAGRKIKGEAIIQAYNIDSFAITALNKGYDYYYEKALSLRKASGYEPFGIINQIIVEGKEYYKTYRHAFIIKEAIKNLVENVTCLGPTEALLPRLYGRYRFSITLKIKEHELAVIKQIKKIIYDKYDENYLVNYYRFLKDFN